jgi:Holliday junction DNA helicase RuvB
LEEVFEPYLLQSGYLDKTARGRVATEQSFQHFGKKRPDGNPRLF